MEIKNDAILSKEYQNRILRLQQRLEGKEIDLALVMYRPELFYFAGSAFDNILAIPREGDPILLIRRPYERSKASTWVSNVVPLKGMRKLPSQLQESGISSFSSIGLELDVLPAKLFLYYRDLFSESKFRDVSGEIRKVRAVKSPSEIGKMRKAAQIVDKGHQLVPEILREG
ncbi:MAG: aminopeptidase P family N-terminal domain-containing protein, partial [Candidatus Hodarchaeota archaeon]